MTNVQRPYIQELPSQHLLGTQSLSFLQSCFESQLASVIIKAVYLLCNFWYIRREIVSQCVTNSCYHFQNVPHEVHIGQCFYVRAG